MSGTEQSASHGAGLPFSIRNILNLPDDPVKSTQPARHARDFDAASPPNHQLINMLSPPIANRSNCSNRLSIPTQFYPLGSRGSAGFPREPRCVNLGDKNNWLQLLRQKRRRPLFSPHQVQMLEKEFDSRKYITETKRVKLAMELKLTETQVKTWFQNRRTKWRKALRNENPPREVPDGRLKCSLKGEKSEMTLGNSANSIIRTE